MTKTQHTAYNIAYNLNISKAIPCGWIPDGSTAKAIPLGTFNRAELSSNGLRLYIKTDKGMRNCNWRMPKQTAKDVLTLV